jgi:hypothetical protein
MPKKKSAKKVDKKVSFQKKKSQSVPSWIWWALGIVVLLAVLFFVYDGVTGNVITGNALKDSVKTTFSDYIQPVLEYLVGYDVKGDTNKMDDFFSMALLILIIVFSIVFIIVKSIPFFNNSEHSWTVWVISISISLLSVRFLSAAWLITILLPYSTLGIAISAGLPFVLYYFLVEKFSSETQKKIAWVFFGLIFLYLWYSRTVGAGAIATATAGDTYYEIYLWTALAALFMVLIGQKAAEATKKKIGGEKRKRNYKKEAAQTEWKKLHIRFDYLKAQMELTAGRPEYAGYAAEYAKVTKRMSELSAIIDAP